MIGFTLWVNITGQPTHNILPTLYTLLLYVTET